MKMTADRVETQSLRPVSAVANAKKTLEGAGFPIRRAIPIAGHPQVDPFVLLDHLGPVVYGPGEALGAPDHPHRGFETVTYLLDGRMRHRDSGGHTGVLGPGDVQWMTAGSGVVHSEMPHPDFLEYGGTLHGFQLWVNLPAAQKMIAPRYQDIPASRIPEATGNDGRVAVRVIAGDALGKSAVIDTIIPITYLHFTLQPGAQHDQPVADGHNAFVYVFAGEARVGAPGRAVVEGQMATLGTTGDIRIGVDHTAVGPAELILLAGPPLKEPIARHGPFVMNTDEEIAQAVRDFREGRMGEIPTTADQVQISNPTGLEQEAVPC